MKSKGYGKAGKDIALLLAASFFYMASPMLVTPLITGFAGELGAGGTLMGLIGGMMNICSLFCRPAAGNLADKMSKYKLSLIGAVFMTAACIGYAAAPGAGYLFAARLLNGVGFACCSVCMSTWMSGLLPKEKIGSGMGLYGSMNAISMALAPAVGIHLHQMFGYRSAFIAAAVFSAATGIIIQFTSDRGKPTAPDASDTPAVPVGKEQLPAKNPGLQVVDKNVLPIALIIMLFTIPYTATQSFLVSYAAQRGLPVTVSLFFPLYALAVLLLRLGLRRYFDRLPFGVFLTGSSISAVGSMVCLNFMKGNLWMLAACIFMAGGYGIMCSVAQSTAILLAGEGRRGLANSTYYVGLDLGMALGPVAGGFLYGNVDLQLFYPFLMLTAPAGLAVWEVCKWKRTKAA